MRIIKLLAIVLLTFITLSAFGKGIDVSRYQKKIDWQRVKGTKIEFVYIKATEGATYTDPYFKQNIAGARGVGIPVGVYHFFRMTSTAQAQFAHFKRIVGDRKMDLIPMIDIEVADGHSTAQIQKRLDALIELFKKEYGVAPIIYSSQVFYNKHLAPRYNRYHLYLGRYGGSRPEIDGKGTYTIWQYSRRGKVDGITTDVDVCRFNPKYTIDAIRMVKNAK